MEFEPQFKEEIEPIVSMAIRIAEGVTYESKDQPDVAARFIRNNAQIYVGSEEARCEIFQNMPEGDLPRSWWRWAEKYTKEESE